MCSRETIDTSRRLGATTCMLVSSRFRLIALRDLAATTAILLAVAVIWTGAAVKDALVFVSRQIPPNGSIYWDVPRDMPGVGPHSRFRVAAPGRLLVREADGTIRV